LAVDLLQRVGLADLNPFTKEQKTWIMILELFPFEKVIWSQERS
jgi:hypothetical protein